MAEGNTLLNALIGAVVAVVLAFVPFSPLLGGATAGYLQSGDRSDALRVGALAGLLASIPLVVLVMVLATVISFLPAFGATGSAIAIAGVFALLAFGLVLLYSIGLGALGGVLGRYLARETEL